MAATTMSPAPARPLTGADPYARPMVLVGHPADFAGPLWFFSDDRSRTIAGSARQPRASPVLQSERGRPPFIEYPLRERE